MIPNTQKLMTEKNFSRLKILAVELEDANETLLELVEDIDRVQGDLYAIIAEELARRAQAEEEIKKFTQGFAYAPRQKPTAVRTKPKVHRMESKRNKRKHDKACRDSKRDKGLSK